MHLPPELWWGILLESVVETAVQSDCEDCLTKSLVTHALVCRSWCCLVHDPWFKRTALRRFYTLGRQFLFSRARY